MIMVAEKLFELEKQSFNVSIYLIQLDVVFIKKSKVFKAQRFGLFVMVQPWNIGVC
jgi:hypothetical protein